MKQKFTFSQKWLLLLCLFFAALQPLKAQIIGDDDVCIDQITFYSFSSSGSSFHWTTSGGMVTAPYGITTNVVWTTVGIHDLALSYLDVNGTAVTNSISIVVHELPNPLIMDYPTLNCSAQGDSTNDDGGNSRCLLACDSSVTHYSTPFSSGSSYQWTVNGDVIDTNPNLNEIDVTWRAVGFGTISVVETNQWGCIDSTSICIEIIESPTAYFGTTQTNVGGVVSICSNQSVIAVDSSTNAVSWSWDYGDGFTSTNQTPPAHVYSTPGTYPLTMEVTNMCGCTDTYAVEIVVDALPGPDITCASVVCSGDTATYTTNADCTGISYDWSVTGGTVDSGLGSNTISVIWGAGADGPGLVTLDVNGCSEFCSTPTMVQIPIVPAVGTITGDSIACSNSTGLYEIPKVPGTTYEWSVSPGYIVGPNNQNEANVYIQDGLHTLTVVYENELLGCGGEAVFEINGLPQMYISGTGQYCEGDNGVFTSINYNGLAVDSNWEVLLPDGTLVSGASTDVFGYDFINGTGTYIITATPYNNDACHETQEFIVEVSPIPEIPAIVGTIEICSGSTQQYTAVSTYTDAIFEWSVENGTLNTTSGNPATVDWDASGPYSISVKQSLSANPSCTSDSVTLDVNIIDTLDITGLATACMNGTSSFTATTLPFSSTYQWTISPASLGSVVSGQGTDNIDIQWLNAAGTATVSLAVAECPTLTQSVVVVIDAVPDPTISGTLSLCEGDVTTLTSSEPTGNTWYDQTGAILGNLQTQDVSVAGNIILETEYSVGCVGQTTVFVDENPSPTASISSPFELYYCGSNTIPMIDLVALDGTGYTFEWFESSNPMTVISMSPIYTTNVVGSYYCEVTADGCTSTSDLLNISYSATCPTGTCETNTSIDFTTGTQCNPVDFFGDTTGVVSGILWNFDDGLASDIVLNPTYSFSHAGYFNVSFSGTGDTCAINAMHTILIPIVADFEVVTGCIGTATQFNSLSTFVSGVTISSYTWDFDDGPLVSGTSVESHVYTSPGSYNVTLTISDGTCTTSITYPVIIDDFTVGFTAGSTCANESLAFAGTSTSTSIISWEWDFDDGTSSTLQNPSKSFDPDNTYNVTVWATNAQGCTASFSDDVIIIPEPTPDVITGDTTACFGSSAALVAPGSSGESYVWSTGETTATINVVESGDYTVTVTTIDGCTYTTAPFTVVIAPDLQWDIGGETVVCEDSYIYLYPPYLGAGFTYQWFHDTNTLGINSYVYINPITTSNSGIYTLEILDSSTGCVSTRSVYVQVNDSPDTPVVQVTSGATPLCADELITIEVSPVDPSVTYQWSNGDIGPLISTYVAGYYTVTATTPYGCNAQSNGITISPLPEVACAMTGCYDFCDSIAPVTIPGPGNYAQYEWLELGGSGYTTVATTQDLEVSMSGAFQLVMTTSAGCIDTTAVIDMTIEPCGDLCDPLAVSYDTLGDCCFLVTTVGIPDVSQITGLNISTLNGESIDLSGLGSGWNIGGFTPTSVNLIPDATDPMTDSLGVICMSDNINPFMDVVFTWLTDSTYDAICTDTLKFECKPDPDCLAIVNDSIYCSADSLIYSFYVENLSDAIISVMDLHFDTASGIDFTPSPITLPSVLPGDTYGPITVGLTGPGVIPGDTVCFTASTHDHTDHDLATFCCHDEIEYCVVIPEHCDPCGKITTEVSVDPFDCCWDISFDNNSLIDIVSIETQILTSGVTFSSIDNPLGSGWNIAPTPSSVFWTNSGSGPVPTSGTLSTICFDDFSSTYPVEVAVNWYATDSSNQICSDTLSFQCENDCVVILSDSLYCKADGSYIYDFELMNNGDFAIEQFDFYNVSLLGATFAPNPITAAIPVGGSASFSVSLAGVMANDTLCFQLRADDELGDLDYLNCCLTERAYCLVIPECCTDPELIINGETSLCYGGSTEICVETCCEDATYSWSNGSTDPCTTVSGPGTYYVKVLCDGIQYNLSTTIDSLASPTVLITDAEYCHNEVPVLLNATPTGGIYSGSSAVSSDGLFDISEINIGSHSVVYNYTDSITGCIGSDDAMITVNEAPDCKVSSEGWIGDRPNTIYTGYGPSCITLYANADTGWSYTWSTGETTQTIDACPTVTTEYWVTIIDDNGCISRCSIVVCVFDIKCKDKEDAVYVCFEGELICISIDDVQDALSNGATLGACDLPDDCKDELEINELITEAITEPVSLTSYPNPSSEYVNLKFEVNEDQHVYVDIQNINGKVVKVLYDGDVQAGVKHQVTYEHTEDDASGMLIARIITKKGHSKYVKLLIK